MMEGFDKDWTYTDSSRRFATYTNLDPGEYTFRVKAIIGLAESLIDGATGELEAQTKANLKLGRIFESFEQASGGTDREYSGTGLGLAVTQQLVELHGGEIWVESTPMLALSLGLHYRFLMSLCRNPYR
mgnify:FL=1